MPEQNGSETVDIQQLAAQMLGLNDSVNEEIDDEDESPTIHPAWQEILNAVPSEYHDQIVPTLQQWDTGVSRRFQKIHDEYAPYKDLESLGSPEELQKALDVYNALINDPKGTIDTVKRVYGLSLDDDDSEEEDELEDLPPVLRNKLSKLDEHERMLASMSSEMLARQAAEAEADEDEALEEYLQDLTEEYGEFDEDFVVGLIAAGVDGDEAVERYQELVSRYSQNTHNAAPKIMSGSGGIPSSEGPNLSKLSNTDTQSLVTELLKMSQSE